MICREQLLAFLRNEVYAVQSSVSSSGAPQSALVGVVVNDRFQVFFDTFSSSRKAANLRTTPVIAFVIGPTDSASVRTVQYEGVVDEPAGNDLDEFLELYFERFPDGRARRNLPEIAYFRVKPTWIRYSDFSEEPPVVVEFREPDLASFTPNGVV